MRKALVVGIDYYTHLPSLHGCVNDALSVKGVLERNFDGTRNFDVLAMTGAGGVTVDRASIKTRVRELFAGASEVALFYFAGHGYIESTGGYLCGTECESGDDGLSLRDLLSIANGSPARNKVIILDSCHAGVAGTSTIAPQVAELSDGMTILTASTAQQYAHEAGGSGVFTTLLVDALSGGAGNLVGEVTPGGVYAHIDQSLGSWEQRPVFKTNVTSFISLRKTSPPIPLADLQRLTELFPTSTEHALDPSYEPTSDAPDPIKTGIFKVLQKYNRVNLVVPVAAEHMYYAAMESTGCRLTVLGEHYRRLVLQGRI